MKWLTSRELNRWDGFGLFFIGYMCAAESHWWMLLILPVAFVSALLEVFFTTP